MQDFHCLRSQENCMDGAYLHAFGRNPPKRFGCFKIELIPNGGSRPMRPRGGVRNEPQGQRRRGITFVCAQQSEKCRQLVGFNARRRSSDRSHAARPVATPYRKICAQTCINPFARTRATRLNFTDCNQQSRCGDLINHLVVK